MVARRNLGLAAVGAVLAVAALALGGVFPGIPSAAAQLDDLAMRCPLERTDWTSVQGFASPMRFTLPVPLLYNDCRLFAELQVQRLAGTLTIELVGAGLTIYEAEVQGLIEDGQELVPPDHRERVAQQAVPSGTYLLEFEAEGTADFWLAFEIAR